MLILMTCEAIEFNYSFKYLEEHCFYDILCIYLINLH